MKSRVRREKVQILSGGGVVLVGKRAKFGSSTNDGISRISRFPSSSEVYKYTGFEPMMHHEQKTRNKFVLRQDEVTDI